MVFNNPNKPIYLDPQFQTNPSTESTKMPRRSILTSLFKKMVRSGVEKPTGLPQKAEKTPKPPQNTDTKLAVKFASQLLNPHVKERFILGMQGDINHLKQLYKDFQEGNPGYGIPQNLEIAKLLQEQIQSKETAQDQLVHPEQDTLNKLTTDRDLQSRLIEVMKNPNIGPRLLEGIKGDYKTLMEMANDFEKGVPGYAIEKDKELSDLLKGFIQKQEPKKNETQSSPVSLKQNVVNQTSTEKAYLSAYPKELHHFIDQMLDQKNHIFFDSLSNAYENGTSISYRDKDNNLISMKITQDPFMAGVCKEIADGFVKENNPNKPPVAQQETMSRPAVIDRNLSSPVSLEQNVVNQASTEKAYLSVYPKELHHFIDQMLDQKNHIFFDSLSNAYENGTSISYRDKDNKLLSMNIPQDSFMAEVCKEIADGFVKENNPNKTPLAQQNPMSRPPVIDRNLSEPQMPWDELIAKGKAAGGKEAFIAFAEAEKLFMQANQKFADKPQSLNFDVYNRGFIEGKTILQNLIEDYNDDYSTEIKLDENFINKIKDERENLRRFRTTYNLPESYTSKREKILDKIEIALNEIPKNDKPPLNISWITKYNSVSGINFEKLTPKEKEDLIDLFERINILLEHQEPLDLAEIAKRLNVPLHDISHCFSLLTPEITSFNRMTISNKLVGCINKLKGENAISHYASLSILMNGIDGNERLSKDRLMTYLSVNEQTINLLLRGLKPDQSGNYKMSELNSVINRLPRRELNEIEQTGRTQKGSLRWVQQ